MITKNRPYISPALQWAMEHVNIEKASRFEGAVWEDFQIDLLNTRPDDIFNAVLKPRQVGFSWAIALIGTINALENQRSSLIFSYREEDAKKKLQYVEWVLEGISGVRLPKCDINTERALIGKAEIKSVPSKGARGGSGVDVFVDEAPEVQNLGAFLAASIPIVTKSGRMFLGGTPKGANGVFYEICEGLNYKNFRVISSPWWEMYALCSNVEKARRLAPYMQTKERVERYGSKRLKIIFEVMTLEEFQQEYELLFIDNSSDFFPMNEIEACLPLNLQGNAPTYEIDGGYLAKWTNIQGYGIDTRKEHYLEAFLAIDQLNTWLRSGAIRARFCVAGYDVGREINTSELCIGVQEYDGRLTNRVLISMDNFSYNAQLAVINYAMMVLPITKITIDATGLGDNLAEDAFINWGDRVDCQKFSSELKGMWVSNAKKLVQDRKVTIIPVKQLTAEIHLIRRKVQPETRTVKFDVPKSVKYHADKAWAFFLMCAGVSANVQEMTGESASGRSEQQKIQVAGAPTIKIPTGSPFVQFTQRGFPKGRK